MTSVISTEAPAHRYHVCFANGNTIIATNNPKVAYQMLKTSKKLKCYDDYVGGYVTLEELE